jgi:histidinol-phosphate aminotransferase
MCYLLAVNAFKPHLSSIAEYPYTRLEARVKLDQNESPDDLPPELKSRALERLARIPWNRYPELHAEDVRAALARHEGWDERGIVLSPGSNMLILGLCVAASKVLDTVPSFPYYCGGAEAAGTPWQGIPLGPDFELPLASLLAAMQGPPGVLFLPNPHAPTGRLFAPEDVEALARRAAETGWLLIVDEAYQAFSGTDYRPLALLNPNVAVLRTFSKSWCLGGIRAGYLLASREVAAVARACVPPFCIPAHTTAILETVLESPGYVAKTVERVRTERERLRSGLLERTSWKVYPSATNFLLVRTADAAATYAQLLEKSVLVRRQDRTPEMAGCLRITVGSQAENDALLEAVRGMR